MARRLRQPHPESSSCLDRPQAGAPPISPRCSVACLPLFDGILLTLFALVPVLAALVRGSTWVFLPIGDEAYHFLNLMSVQESFLRGEGLWQRLLPLLVWTDPHAYPPIGYLVPALFGVLGGETSLSGLPAQQVPWMVLIVFSTYLLGRRLFEGTGQAGRRVGLMSAFLVALAPTLVGYLPAPLLDLAATATTLLALLVLAWNQDTRSPVATCAMGGAVAVAFLTKWTALVVLAPALVLVSGRLLGGRPRRELLAGLGVLVFMALGLTIPLLLLQLNRPVLDRALGWPLPGSIFIVLVSVAVVAGVARLLADRLGPGPTRNVVLAVTVAALLISPFLLWNQDAMMRRLDRHSDDRAAARFQLHGATTLPLPHVWGDPGRLTEFTLGGLALLWLAFRGPRGSLGLLVGPILATAMLSRDPALQDYRYTLPAVPLLILAVVGCLQAHRATRAASTALFLGLGLFNLALWLTGDVVPCQPGHQVQPGNLGTGPASLSGQVARLVDAVALHTGPDPEAVWTVVRSPLLLPGAEQSDSPQESPRNSPIRRTFHDSIQIVALLQGQALVVRGVLEEGEFRVTPADLSVIRILFLRRPETSLRRLHDQATADAARVRNGWVLVLSPPGLLQPQPRLPGVLGRPVRLPSVEGLEAHLYPFTADHPSRPQRAPVTGR